MSSMLIEVRAAIVRAGSAGLQADHPARDNQVSRELPGPFGSRADRCSFAHAHHHHTSPHDQQTGRPQSMKMRSFRPQHRAANAKSGPGIGRTPLPHGHGPDPPYPSRDREGAVSQLVFSEQARTERASKAGERQPARAALSLRDCWKHPLEEPTPLTAISSPAPSRERQRAVPPGQMTALCIRGSVLIMKAMRFHLWG